jgi:hypothetical protein
VYNKLSEIGTIRTDLDLTLDSGAMAIYFAN